MNNEKQAPPAVQIAKEKRDEGQEIVTFSTGVKVRLLSVGASLIAEAQMRIKEPPVPMFLNEDKGREEENPNDPDYLRELAEVASRRTQAGLDAMALFGFELVDGMPEDDAWLKKLQFMEKLGHIDLSGFDLGDPLDREFLYRKHIALGSSDLVEVGMRTGIRQRDVADAVRSFRGPEEQPTD